MRRALYPIIFGGSRFNLASYLAGVSGSYWDFTKTDDQFQENTGPTPADDIGEAIGLKLDRAQWGGQTLAQVIAAASELVTNGAFPSDLSGWTNVDTGTGVSDWNGGTARLVGVDASNRAQLRQTIATVVGATYRLSVEAAQVNSGQLLYRVGTAAGGTQLLADVSLTSAQTSVRYFTATTTTTFVQLHAITGNGKFDNVSVKLIPGLTATQSSGSLKPLLQSTGAKFDGSDDNLLTSYLAAAGANFIVALVTVPASMPSNPAVFGAAEAAFANLVYLGLDSSTGRVRCSTGSSTAVSETSGLDLRGTAVVIGMSFDAAIRRMFSDAMLADERAQSGTPTTTVPMRMGSLNIAGSATSWYGGSIKRLVAGKDFLSLQRYQQIRSALLAA